MFVESLLIKIEVIRLVFDLDSKTLTFYPITEVLNTTSVLFYYYMHFYEIRGIHTLRNGNNTVNEDKTTIYESSFLVFV